MNALVAEERFYGDVPEIDYNSLVTEDDQPVDNIFSEKQQRLLVEPLYSSWKPETPFMAAANVGVYSSPYQPPIVPDMFLSLDVQPDEDMWEKRNQCYFVWKYDKPPEVVIEVVSNKEGGETGKKFTRYAKMGIWYYIIFDPQKLIQKEALQIHQLSLRRYVVKKDTYLDLVDLGLSLWDGMFEGMNAQWLRWCDADGIVIPTGEEARLQEHQRAEQVDQRAKQADQRAEQEHQRAERLAAKLRELGVDPGNGNGQ